MEQRDRIWERLQLYRHDLTSLCDEVSFELNQQRRVREEWQLRTRRWKEIWLPDRKQNS